MTWNPTDLFKIFKGKADDQSDKPLQLTREDFLSRLEQDDLTKMSMKHKYTALRQLVHFLKLQAEPFASDARKEALLEQKYSKEISMGEKIYRSINYTAELREDFNIVTREVASQLYQYFKHNDITQRFSRMDVSERGELGQMISDIYMNTVQRVMHPDIALTPVASHNSGPGLGWVYLTAESIITGEHTPIFVNDQHLRKAELGDFVNTICHEANHHAFFQLAVLAERGEIEVPDIHERDIMSVLEMREQGVVTPPFINRMYRADPFEQLAFRSGDGVERLLELHLKAQSPFLDPSVLKMAEMLIDRDVQRPSSENHQAVQHFIRNIVPTMP